MDTSVKVILGVTSAISLYLLFRLHTRPGHWLGKIVFTVVLLVPFVGWIAYLFLVEDVPPQPEDLRNNGVHGFYTDKMITHTRPQDDAEAGVPNKEADKKDDAK